MRKFSCAALVVVSATASPAAERVPGDELASRFGARPAVEQISLSPDGERVAIVSPDKGQGNVLIVTRPGLTEVTPIMRASGAPDRLTDCHWVSNTRIVCRIYLLQNERGKTIELTRTVAIDADGANRRMLSAFSSANAVRRMQRGGDVIDWLGGEGGVLMTRDYVPEALNDDIGENRDGFGVERVDTATLKRSTVEQPDPEAVEYLADGGGRVRIIGTRRTLASGYGSPVVTYRYRLNDDRQWRPLGALNLDSGQGFDPYAVDRTTNVVYGFERHDGRRALYSIALDGSLAKKPVFARPDVDVDGLVRIGRQGRVVGASFATDRRQTVFFDPDLQKLQASLARKLPRLPLITFLDADAPENRLLLWVGSDVDPGHYYVFDKKTRHLDEVMLARPALAEFALAPVKAITFPATDGTPVPAYLTLPVAGPAKGLPAIVMPHGGPGSRDEWGFDWLSQYFAARGFAVLQPNFRGSAGYGDAWFQKNGFQSWRTAVGDVNDAGAWMTKEGIAGPDKLAIVGWSYGGYAALQSAVLDPRLFKAIVAIAPVTDLESLRGESRGYRDYALVDRFIGRGAHVREGSPAQNAARIKAPVLMFHGTLDRNVGVAESKLMADRLKAAGTKPELILFDGLDHQLDDADARARLLDATDAFLRRSLSLAPPAVGS